MPRTLQKFILVVDDDSYVRNIFVRAFEGQDSFVLDTAQSVDEALRKLRTMFFDMVFLDMKIGHRYAGMEVLEELRKQEIKLAAEGTPYLSTLVIIMSGSISLNDITQEAHGLDVFHFIDKPVPMTEEFVRRVVNRFGLPLLPRRRVQ
jgi:DNA-binding NtrC family response regulator